MDNTSAEWSKFKTFEKLSRITRSIVNNDSIRTHTNQDCMCLTDDNLIPHFGNQIINSNLLVYIFSINNL